MTFLPGSPSRAGNKHSKAALAAGLPALLLPCLAQALSWEFDNGAWTIDLDTIVSYSAQWRVEKQDRDKFAYKDLGDTLESLSRYSLLVNAQDGNYNFSRGLVQNKFSFITEMDIQHEDFGFFARARGYYDSVYDSDTDLSREDYRTYNSGELYGGDAAFGDFPSRTVDEHRDRLEMLDYYLYFGGSLPGERLFDIRAGSQVINWGVSTFFQGINGLQNRADLIARNTPGVEVKEILLPTGAIYGQVDLVPDVTLELYAQYEWKETELNGVGSYFSDRDFLGPGADNFLIAFSEDSFVAIPRVATEDASDSGQWGAALHWLTPGGMDFGFYYVNAHSKAPAYRLNRAGLVPTSYTVEYFEDIQGYAASFTTVLGITNIQGEVSYQTDRPVVNAEGDPEQGDVLALQIGGSHVLTPTRLWDDASLIFEVAATKIDSHSDRELRYDDLASAVALRLELSYLNVRPGLDIKVPFFLQHTFDGTILEANMIDKANVFNVTVKGIYLNNFTVQLGYSAFFDGGEDHLITDRDNLSLSLSYSF